MKKINKKEIEKLNQEYIKILGRQAKGIKVDEEQITALEYLIYKKSNGN